MSKRLIVCCDGTWNTADQAKRGRPCPTNVIKLALSISKVDDKSVEQRVYYHPGVGTSRWDRLDHWSGGAFGVGLSANVLDAYQFLVDTYEDGDDLYFFGFSRGAFTARSLVGLVRNCGVLRRENADRIQQAYELYRDRIETPRGMASTAFRRGYSFEPGIRFIGVWDTVGALGIPALGPSLLQGLTALVNKRWAFHDTTLSSHVHAAYQALAIDEQRRAFEPTLWDQQPEARGKQVLEQVWFAGVHCDVGGGLESPDLSDLALLWMVEKAQLNGITFDQGAFQPGSSGSAQDPTTAADFTVAPNPDCLPHESRTGIFLLDPAWHRPIDTPTGPGAGPGQYVADTAVKLRRDRPDRYKPPRLIDYLEKPHPDAAAIPLTFTPI
jgi:uncharacterized protein (DUF2235 family)